MNSFLVVFTLHNADRDYMTVANHLRNYRMWARVIENAWIVKTNESASDIRSLLSTAIHGEGNIAVFKITETAWASYDINSEVTEWMQRNV